MITVNQAFIDDPDASRYDYDTCLPYSKGWCQVDTSEDASYYGNWTNPSKMQTITYAEGDVYNVISDTPADYREHLVQIITRHRLGNRPHAMVDLGISSNRNQLRDQFNGLGLGAYIH